jgi:phosphoglycerate dehydrogenase-like enzyme/glyoxylase-like metal-dependent hydrolase (beta-lactamase superfamily II)
MVLGARIVLVAGVVAAPFLWSNPHEPGRAPRAKVLEVAPGVFFAEAAVAPTFEGANSGFVIQDDQVIVLEASMPAVAAALRPEIAARTAAPIRVVFDTHDHWDHSFGNAIHAEQGALVAASARCADLLAARGPAAFEEMARSDDPARRAQVAGTRFVGASLRFDERLVVGAGRLRVEFLHLGRGHTHGDAVAWLPEERVLFTGDLCVNGASNYMGDADTEHWIVVLERLMALRPKVVCPGHGAMGGPELLERQRRWLVDLRAHVGSGVDSDAEPEAITAAFDLPWYREWTGVPASSRSENVASVFDELTGRRSPPMLTVDLGLVEGPSPSRADPGWSAPRKVVVVGAGEDEVRRLGRAVPGLVVVGTADVDDAEREVADADALIGACDASLLERAKKLRWVQVGSAGVERYVGLPAIAQRKVVLTNAQRLYGPEIADHAMGLVLSLLRGLPASRDEQRGERRWQRSDGTRGELDGRVVLVAGLGGIGREIATRAAAFGARVIGTGSAPRPPSGCVERIEGPEKLLELAAIADVVFVCVPLTRATDRLCDSRFFAALKPGALLCNVARGRCVDSDALLAALESGRLAGAALDVTDPEPLPPDHPLWALPQVLITPHVAADSEGAETRRFLLDRENLRRFAAGERLLSVVDPAAGY